jgi:hypothetical protein
MSLRSTWLVWTLVFATAEVATREATANVVIRVFMDVSFVSVVRLLSCACNPQFAAPHI